VGEPFALTWSVLPGDVSEHVSDLQLRALVIIRGRGGIAVSDLARAMGLLPSSVTRLCDRLIAAGLIVLC
jgi:DNA-binding MarR family transcriptional regulator